MSWFTRMFVLPKDLNSGGDFIRKYSLQIEMAIRQVLIAKSEQLGGVLDAEDVSDYIIKRINIPSWGKIMVSLAMYGILEKYIGQIKASTGPDEVEEVVQAIMGKLRALK